MEEVAFTPSILPGRTTFCQPQVTSRHEVTLIKSVKPLKVTTTRMVVDNYMATNVRRQYKQSGVPFGEYTVQCTEGTTPGAAEEKRVMSLAAAFRARQASPSARYADLYNTRRLAILGTNGCHREEQQVCNLPIAAYACVIGKMEAMGACNRYRDDKEADAKYMNRSVERGCRMGGGGSGAVGGGEFGVMCTEGNVKGQAETARVNALGTAYRARQMSQGQKERAKYNASLNAINMYSNGCDYEESLFMRYPMAAGAMKGSTGVYAAGAAGASGFGGPAEGRKVLPLALRLKGPNAQALWPSYLRRPAVQKKRAPWESSGVKSYSPMSEAALQSGIAGQSKPFKSGAGDVAWSPGWQPSSSAIKSYV